MESFLKPLTDFLQDVAICLAVELFMYMGHESPMSSLDEIILYTIFARHTAYPFELVVYSICALIVFWVHRLVNAFSEIPLDNESEFLMQSLSHGFISMDEFDQGVFGDWSEVVFPIAIITHYIYMVFVYCFIILSILSGLMLQSCLPTFEVLYLPLFRFARSCLACVWGVVSLLGKVVGGSKSASSQLLDWFLPENPVFLLATSTGLVISDMLSAIWTANAITPVYSRIQFNSLAILSGLFDNNNNLDLVWDLEGSKPQGDWKLHVVELLRITVRSYSTGFARWYDNVYADDGLRHFPALTLPITLGLLVYGCKLLWEDKPRHLVELELIVEESLLMNAVIQDFESHLSQSQSKTEAFGQMLAATSGLLSGALAQCKELLTQRKSLNAEVQNLRNRAIIEGRRHQGYVDENVSLHRENAHLQRELNELRLVSDVEAYKENIRAVNAQLAASNDENDKLRGQNSDLEKECDALREAKSAADAKAATAKKDADVQEQNADWLRQEKASLQQAYQQLVDENQALAQAKSVTEEAAERGVGLIETLSISNRASEEKCQSLQSKVKNMEKQLTENDKAAEEARRSLKAEMANMETQHNSMVKGLHVTNKKRDAYNRKIRRLQQKKVNNMKHKFMAHDQKLNIDIKNLQKDNQRLEHRLVQLDPSSRGQTQVIHDARWDNEIAQLKHQLQNIRSRNIVLNSEVKQLKDENAQLHRQATAVVPSPVAPPPASPSVSAESSFSRSQSESEQLVALRNELKSKNEELQRLRIQLSNAQLSKKSGGSNLFMPRKR